ncbi:MAG: NUDIX domain-containing protein, partial [Pseudomonadota bacterium]
GEQENYPIKIPKAKKPTRKGAAFVITNSKDQVFLCKRGEHGLLAGMTQVPTTDWNSRNDGATGIATAPADASWQNRGTVRHTFTHFHLELEVWSAAGIESMPINGWWCEQAGLDGEALPTVMRKVLHSGMR